MVTNDKKKQVKTQQMEFNPVIISALRYYNWVVFSHQNFSLGGLGALAGMVVAMVIFYKHSNVLLLNQSILPHL